LTAINALPIDPYNPNNNILINPAITQHVGEGIIPVNNEPYIIVSLEDDTLYVQEDDTVYLEFYLENTGGVTGKVTMQFDESDEDYKEYFTVYPLSKEKDVKPGDEELIKFKLNVDHIPDDSYDIEFKVFVSYEKAGQTIDFAEDSISVELNVDDYSDLDVELEDNVICLGSEYPAMTYLVFTNETSDRYFVDPQVKHNEKLWPSVISSTIVLEEDEETRVPIYFRKKAPVGTYEIEFDQRLHEGSANSTETRLLTKTLNVYVENCNSYNTSFTISPQNQNMKNNDKVDFSFDFYNSSENNIPVHFKGTTNDNSMAVAFPNDTVIVNSNDDYTGTFSVLTSDNTTSGIKTITLTAETPYTTITKTVNVNVLKADISVTASSIDIPAGLKGKQEIKIQNNTNIDVYLALTITPQGQDVILLDRSAIAISAGQTTSVYAEILPKSVGSKTYTLHISGSVEKDVVIGYTSNSEAGIINFVSNYSGKANAVTGIWATFPVTVENPYNFQVTLRLRLLPTDAITSKTSTVILEPKQRKTINVQFIVNSSVRNIRGTLEVASDISSNTYPVYILVSPDTSLTNALELADDVTTIAYTNGESNVTLKIYNPNGFAISNANVSLLNAEGSIIGETTFHINSNETKDVEVKFVLDSAEDTTGSVFLTANTSENTYDIVYTKAGFMTTGLFNLGLGGTISILLGALIVVLLIVYFTVRNPSLPEVQ
jgi:hypothetical protein